MVEVRGESGADAVREPAAAAPSCPSTTSGFRAYRRQLLETLPWSGNSDDFVFDNQLLAQAIVARFRIGEISVPTRYFAEASSIDFPRAVRYGMGVVTTTLLAFFARTGLYRHPLFVARRPG